MQWLKTEVHSYFSWFYALIEVVWVVLIWCFLGFSQLAGAGLWKLDWAGCSDGSLTSWQQGAQQTHGLPCDVFFSEHGGWVLRGSLLRVSVPRNRKWKCSTFWTWAWRCQNVTFTSFLLVKAVTVSTQF